MQYNLRERWHSGKLHWASERRACGMGKRSGITPVLRMFRG